MATTYRITLKSEEQRGATQPNIIELGFDTDDDATTFAANCELMFNAQAVSVDKLLSSDYSLPYPAGTDGMTRTAITDGAGHWMNIRVFDTPAAFAPVARAAALIAAGIQIPSPDGTTFVDATTANVQVFNPGPSV